MCKKLPDDCEVVGETHIQDGGVKKDVVYIRGVNHSNLRSLGEVQSIIGQTGPETKLTIVDVSTLPPEYYIG